jgi:hypothetical protein
VPIFKGFLAPPAPTRLGPRVAFYGRFRHAIPTHIRPQVRDLALRRLVALMVAVELATLLWWRRADDDHQNEGGGINHWRG